MLSLTRKEGETITIGENITVTVQAINGNQVRIGIDAPREVPVHRGNRAAHSGECGAVANVWAFRTAANRQGHALALAPREAGVGCAAIVLVLGRTMAGIAMARR